MGRITDKKVVSFISKVKKKFNAKILLFGSRAKENELKESDYDFCVISDKFNGIHVRKRLQMLYELMIDTPFNADLLALTPKEFDEVSKELTIYKTIREEGIKV